MKEQEHYAESVQYSIDRTKASLQELAHDFLSSDLLKGLIEGANQLLQLADKVLETFGSLKTVIGGLAIADFGRGVFSNTGLFASITEILGNKKLEGGAKNTFLGTLSALFDSSSEKVIEEGAGKALGKGVTEAGKKAGKEMAEEVVEESAEAFAKAGMKDVIVDTAGNVVGEGVGEVVGDAVAKTAKEAVSESAGKIAAEGAEKAVENAVANAAAKGTEQAAAKGATNFVTKFASALAAHPIAAIIGGALITALSAKAIYSAYKDNLVKTANTATDTFQDRKDQISGYEERYASINEKLSSSDTSETERVQLRQQLIDLQREIVSGLGSEAAGIDVVNGKYEEQVGLMDRLVEKQAEKNLNDKDVQKAYKDAEDEMTKSRTYSLGEIFDMSDRTIGKKFFDSVKDEIDGLGLDLADGEGLWYDENSYEIKFKGDATEASQAISVVESQLEKFRTKYKDDDYVQGVLNGVSDGMQNAVKDNEELLDKYQENYKNFLEQEFYTDDATKNNRTALRDMARAATDLNTAIASGDTKTFNEALSAYEDINKTAEGFGDKYKVVFDDIRDTIDETGKSAMEFKDVLDDDGIIGKDNPLAKQADELKQAAEEVKEEGLQAIDLQDLDLTPEKASESLKKLAGAFDIAFNGTDEDNAKIKSLISTLVELGVVADDVSNNIEATAEDSFESFRSSIINDIANIDTLNAAIAESFTGKGLSYSIDENTGDIVGSVKTIKDAYADFIGDAGDSSKLFEHTANGIHLNMEEMRKLQSVQEASKKSRLREEELKASQEVLDLERKISEYDESRHLQDNYDFDSLNSQLESAKEHLANVKDLEAAYNGATSAYQKWVNAQSMGEEGDMYETIRETALSRGKELRDAGLVGTNEFRAIAQLFSNKDLTTAPITDIIDAYDNGSEKVSKFFTEGREGWENFATYLQGLGSEFGTVTGDIYDGFTFFGTDTEKIAENLGVSKDLVESIFKRMEDYGYTMRFFDPEQEAQLRNIKSEVDGIQSSLKETEDFHINVNGVEKDLSQVLDFDIADIGLDADALQQKITELSAATYDPDVNPEQLELLNQLIEQCQQNLDILNGYHVSPEGPNLETWEAANSALQTYEQRMQILDQAHADGQVDLTIEGDSEAMQIVDRFMNDPDLAAMAHIDISGGRDDVIDQLEKMHTNGIDIQADVDTNVDSGEVQNEVSSAVSGASGTPDVSVNEGSVTSQTEEGIKNADGTTVTPEVNTSSVQSETESALNTAANKTYKAKVTVDNHSLSQQIRSAVSKSQPKATKTTNETVTKETKETNIKTEVSGNAEADLAQLQSMASKPMNAKINVDTNADVAVAKLQSIAHTPLEGKLKISVDDSEVKSWKAPDKTGMVKYFVNGGNVSAWSPPEKAGYVRYNVTGTSPVYNWQPPKKTGTVSYNVKADGTAHWQGTAGGYYSPRRNGSVGNSFINHYNGTAYARGNWGLKHDEPNALINELGTEIIVRDGQWMIANNGFPTLADSPKGVPGGLQKGDIIFNHKQAEDILKHGYVTGSHARMVGGGAHAEGTVVGGHAFSGTGPGRTAVSGATTTASNSARTVNIDAGLASVSGKKVEDNSTNKDSNKSTTTTKKKSTKGNASLIPDNISVETFDFIEIKLKRLEDQISDFKRTADSAFKSFAARATATASELDSVTEAIAANETAIVKYEARAETTLRTGKYRLTGREKKQAKKAGIGNSVDEIRDNLVKGAFKISDIKTNSDVQKKYDSAKTKRDKAKKGTKEWNKQNKKLKKLKSKLKNEKAKESLKNKLSQFQEWIDKAEEASNQAEELREQQKELYQQQFELARTEYEGKLNPLETRSGLMESWISENENKGNYTSTKVYETLAVNEQSKYNTLLEERGVLIKKLQDAIAGGIAINGEEYNEMQSAINDVTKSLYEAKASQEEFNKKVRELEYENFKNLQDRISNVSEELSFLADIMSENPMFGEKGTFTEYGIATLGVYATQYEIAMKQAEEYTDKIQRLQSIINGTYKASANESVPGIKEAREQLVELQSSQRSVIKSAYDMRKSIKSLVEDGFKEEINSIKDIISEYEKMLDTQKSEYDYSKKITEQQEKITSLRRQIASWGNDSSEEGAAKRQKAEKELRDAEQTLQETQEERRISQIKEMLSDMQDQYEKLFNGRTDEVTVLIDNILNSIGNYQGNIGSTLSNVIGKSKLTKSSELEDLLKKFNEEAAVPIEKSLETGVTISGLMGAGDSVIGGISSVSTINSGIESKVDGILSKLKETWKMEITNADQIAVQISNKINTDSANTQPEQKTSSGSSGSSTGGVTGANSKTLTTSVAKSVNQNHADEARKYIQKKASKAKKKRKEYSDVNKKIYDMTGGKVLSTDELKSLAKKIGTTYNGADSKNNLYKRLKTLKVFKRGTRRVQDNDYYWTQEGRGQNELITRKSDGAMLTRLGSGDMVFNAEMTKTLWNFAKDPVPFMTNGTIKAPDVSSNITYGDSNIDITFNVPNVTNADEFMRTLQKSKKFEQIVQSMTIGRIQGKGTLNKYNTRI